jgi:PAS domain-containing protein
MVTNGATLTAPAPAWTDPRVHLLDDTWLLTIFAILLATALPWLVSAFDIDFLTASLGLLVLGAIHFAFSVLGRPARTGERRRLLTGLHVAGVLVVGFIWMQVGGFQNPGFLMVFALPVVGAIFLSRWQPYLMALLAIGVVGAVALAQVPELRWYAPGLNTAGAWLATVLGQQGAAANVPFRGFYAPSSYFVVLLQVFAILVFACAVAAEYLGAIFERLHTNVDLARVEAERGQQFWATLIEDLPLPVLLVDIDTLHVVCASEEAAAFCAAEPGSGNNTLFEAVRFSYPEVVQELITRAGGVVPLSMIHVGDRLYATEVRVQQVSQKDRRLALVIIADKTEEFTARAALDAVGQAVLVIDAQSRILAFNKPALSLFAGLERDADASSLLSLASMQERWWEPGITGRRKMHVEIAPRIYEVTTLASPLPGEDAQVYVVTLLPVARAATGNQSTIATSQFTQPTSITGSNHRLVSPP